MLFNSHRIETSRRSAGNAIDVGTKAFICRREKWNYDKVEWSSNDPTWHLRIHRRLAAGNFKVPLLSFYFAPFSRGGKADASFFPERAENSASLLPPLAPRRDATRGKEDPPGRDLIAIQRS